MYKVAFLGCALGMCLATAQAEESPAVMLYSTVKNQGVAWTPHGGYYFKAFDAVLLNAGQKAVPLGTLCYQAYDAKGQVYQLDAVDETLTQGSLGPGESVKGFYQFSGQDEGVYNATMVKATECKP